jgi:DNA-binding transcriptional ArsR family regulator
MDVDDAEEYTQALGQVVAGGWRQIALGERLGVPAALGLTTRDWVDQRLGGYVRLSIPERREAIAELVKGEGMTQRQAADVLGVDEKTVRRDRAADAALDAQTLASNGASDKVSAADAADQLKQRIAQLDEDLAERVRGGLSIDEAESVTAERRRRVTAWIKKVREALLVLSRMKGSPIPAEFTDELSDQERSVLDAVLGAIPEGSSNDSARV